LIKAGESVIVAQLRGDKKPVTEEDCDRKHEFLGTYVL